MADNNTQPTNHMDTSQQLKHVFGCLGPELHITPGFKLLQSADPTKCPQCGADVYDATNTPVGEAYVAFGRADLGKRPS